MSSSTFEHLFAHRRRSSPIPDSLWHSLPPSKNSLGSPPSERSGHISCIDSSGTYFYVFGGYHDGLCFRDLHVMHIPTRTWRLIETRGDVPSETASHSAVLDGGYLLVFGGSNVPFGHSNSDKLHLCCLETGVWEELCCGGDKPSPRYGHTLVKDPDSLDIFLFGGTSGINFFNDTYRLDAMTRKWTRIETTGDIPYPRYRHEVAIYKGALYVVGGGAPNPTGIIDVHRLDLSSKVWTIVGQNSTAVPLARRSHTCNLYKGKLYLYGGANGYNIFTDLWTFDLDKEEWKFVPTSHSHVGRYFHTSCVTPGGIMYSFGGCLDLLGLQRTNEMYSCRLDVPPLLDLCVAKLSSASGEVGAALADCKSYLPPTILEKLGDG